MLGYIVLNIKKLTITWLAHFLTKLPTNSYDGTRSMDSPCANAKQFLLYHSGAPNHPLIYPIEIID